MEVQKVSSELYTEDEYENADVNSEHSTISKFFFKEIPYSPKADSVGDLEVARKNNEYNNVIEIEHSKQTALDQVGLQIWRGALLLADWLIYNHKTLPNGYILELGSGVGLTSIIASVFRPVICTDMNVGGLLGLIEKNIKKNSSVSKNFIKVMELNFLKEFSEEIIKLLPKIELILAADVVYDDRITDGLIKTIEKLLNVPPKKFIYIAIEKRYVFTIADLDSCAPCYEYLTDKLSLLPNIQVEKLSTDFPQFFKYRRTKELVILKITLQS